MFFSRMEMIKKNTDLILSAIQEKTLDDTNIEIRQKGKVNLKGIANARKLQEFLDKNLKEMYSQNNNDYYLFEVVEKGNKRILTFQEAVDKKILKTILDDFLENKYPEIRAQYPSKFINEREKIKDFQEVKWQVGAYVFKDLLKSIDVNYRIKNPDPNWKPSFGPNDEIAKRWLFCFMNLQKEMLEKENIEVLQDKTRNLINQWLIEENNDELSRKDNEKIFSLTKNEYSPVFFNNYSAFYRLEDFEIDNEEKENDFHQKRLSLEKEIKEELSKKVIDEIFEKKLIVLPIK